MPTLSDDFILAAAGLLYDAQQLVEQNAERRGTYIPPEYPADMSRLNAMLDNLARD